MKLPVLALVLALAPGLAAAEFTFSRLIPYQDESIIQANVIEQCRSLGERLSEHIAQGMTAQGLAVLRVDELDLAQGRALDIKITNLVSAGNAFIGHRKSLTVSVKAYANGEVVHSKVFSRNTMGGVTGGFKGSCDVLERAAEAIGKDVGRWFKERA